MIILCEFFCYSGLDSGTMQGTMGGTRTRLNGFMESSQERRATPLR